MKRYTFSIQVDIDCDSEEEANIAINSYFKVANLLGSREDSPFKIKFSSANLIDTKDLYQPLNSKNLN